MAKLPNITEEVKTIPGAVNSGIGVSNINISPVNEATNKLGATLEKAGEKIVETDNHVQRFNYALSKNRLQVEHAALVNQTEKNLSEGLDYGTAQEIYQSGLKQIGDTVSKDLTHPAYKAEFENDVAKLGQSTSGKIDEMQRQAQQNHALVLANDRVDPTIAAILTTKGTEAQLGLLKSLKATVAAAIPAGPNQEIDIQKSDQNINRRVGEATFDSMNASQQVHSIDSYLKDSKKPSVISLLPPEKIPELRKRAMDQVQATVKTEVRDQVNDIEQAGKMGLNVPKEKILSVAARARSVGMTDISSALEKYSVVQDSSNEFATKSLAQQQTELTNVRNNVESGNLGDVDKYRAFSQVYETKLKILKEDPRSYYAAHGVISPTQPIEITNPNSVAQGVASRRIENQKVKTVEGNNFELPILNKQEIDQLKSMNQTASPDKMGAVLNNIGSNLFPSERASLARQLSKEDSPTLAVAMSLDPKDSINILAGSKLKGEVSTDKLRRETASKLSGLVIDPEQNEVFQSAIYDYYKKLAFDTGNVEKDVDNDLLDRAIEKTVGKPVEISPYGKRSKVFTYRDNSGNLVPEDDLEDTFSSIDNDVLKKSNGSLPLLPSGDVVDAKEILKDTKMVTYGNGLYVPYYEGVGFLTGKDGQPYVLDAKKIKEITGNVPAKGNVQTRPSQSIFGFN